MAYEKQNFTDGQVLTAAHLNHIENGIDAVAVVVPSTAAVGQFIVVSAVDADGKITATEAVTLTNAEEVSF